MKGFIFCSAGFVESYVKCMNVSLCKVIINIKPLNNLDQLTASRRKQEGGGGDMQVLGSCKFQSELIIIHIPIYHDDTTRASTQK